MSVSATAVGAEAQAVLLAGEQMRLASLWAVRRAPTARSCFGSAPTRSRTCCSATREVRLEGLGAGLVLEMGCLCLDVWFTWFTPVVAAGPMAHVKSESETERKLEEDRAKARERRLL